MLLSTATPLIILLYIHTSYCKRPKICMKCQCCVFYFSINYFDRIPILINQNKTTWQNKQTKQNIINYKSKTIKVCDRFTDYYHIQANNQNERICDLRKLPHSSRINKHYLYFAKKNHRHMERDDWPSKYYRNF